MSNEYDFLLSGIRKDILNLEKDIHTAYELIEELAEFSKNQNDALLKLSKVVEKLTRNNHTYLQDKTEG